MWFNFNYFDFGAEKEVRRLGRKILVKWEEDTLVTKGVAVERIPRRENGRTFVDGRGASVASSKMTTAARRLAGRIAILFHVTWSGDVAIDPVGGDLHRLRCRPGTNADGIGTVVEGIAEVTGDTAEIATVNLRRGKENGGLVNENADDLSLSMIVCT